MSSLASSMAISLGAKIWKLCSSTALTEAPEHSTVQWCYIYSYKIYTALYNTPQLAPCWEHKLDSVLGRAIQPITVQSVLTCLGHDFLQVAASKAYKFGPLGDGYLQFLGNWCILLFLLSRLPEGLVHDVDDTPLCICHLHKENIKDVLWSYTPSAVLKIKDLGTAPGHWLFPEAREFSQPISAKSVFRQPGFPWNYLIGSRYHLTLFVGVAVADPVPVPVTVTARFLFPVPLNLLWQLHIFV